MEWDISLSRQAEKFLSQRHLPDELVIEPIRKAIQKLLGESVAIELKRLAGRWAGCFRIRSGKIRIIFSINFENHKILVEIIDNRDRAYR